MQNRRVDVTSAVRVDADGQHEGLVALDALVALDLVLGLGGGGDVRRHACGCGCVLLVLGFPAGYAGLVCLRVGRGFSLRAGSVRGYEALFAVARPRGAMAACVGCFLLFGGLPSASRRARFSVRARARASTYIHLKPIGADAGRVRCSADLTDDFNDCGWLSVLRSQSH